jgi:hypothetical protein
MHICWYNISLPLVSLTLLPRIAITSQQGTPRMQLLSDNATPYITATPHCYSTLLFHTLRCRWCPRCRPMHSMPAKVMQKGRSGMVPGYLHTSSGMLYTLGLSFWASTKQKAQHGVVACAVCSHGMGWWLTGRKCVHKLGFRDYWLGRSHYIISRQRIPHTCTRKSKSCLLYKTRPAQMYGCGRTGCGLSAT